MLAALVVRRFGHVRSGRGLHWARCWDERQCAACVRLAVALGGLPLDAPPERVRAADPGRRALDLLELAWCASVCVDERPVEFARQFESLPHYLEQFAGEGAELAAAHLLHLLVEELPPLVRGSGWAADRPRAVLDNMHHSLARALHFLLAALRTFDWRGLADAVGNRLLAQLRALGFRGAELQYKVWRLHTAMSLVQPGRLGLAVFGPEREGVFISHRTEAAWTAFWFAALQRLAAEPGFCMTPCNWSFAHHVCSERRALDQLREHQLASLLAAETNRRNQLRVRALRPAFRLAQDHLCSAVLAFLG